MSSWRHIQNKKIQQKIDQKKKTYVLEDDSTTRLTNRPLPPHYPYRYLWEGGGGREILSTIRTSYLRAW